MYQYLSSKDLAQPTKAASRSSDPPHCEAQSEMGSKSVTSEKHGERVSDTFLIVSLTLLVYRLYHTILTLYCVRKTLFDTIQSGPRRPLP